MDAGRRDDEDDRLGAAAAPPSLIAHHLEAPASPNQHRLTQHHHSTTDSPNVLPHSHYLPPAYLDVSNPHFDRHHPAAASTSSRPSASYAVDNLAVFAAHSASLEASAHRTADDYYRNAHQFDDTTDFADSDYDDPMASAVPVPRQPAGPATRSSRHSGTPTKTTGSPPSAQHGVKAGFRSVSAPVDEKALATSRARAAAASSSSSGGHKPSVKDLKKKFDQDSARGSPGTPNKSTPRASSRGPTTPSSYRGIASSPASGRETSYAALRYSTNNRDGPPSATKSTQRARAVAEDLVSSNPQSFASRVHKPRVPRESSTPLSPTASKLPPRSPSDGQIASPKQARGLLFGEILPGQSDIGSVGYGIQGLDQNSFPASGNLLSPKHHGRSHSQSEIEPPSPSDWYRNTSAASDRQENQDSEESATHAKKHTRAHSDDPYKKSPASRSKPPQVSRPPPLASSRLPKSVRNNMSASSSSASPTSSRANSPAFSRRQGHAQGKTTNSSPAPASKSSAANGSRRAITASSSMPGSNTRLNAYIATPPPKLSPPLRSSRPRQPVSTASTASSRIRAAETQRSKSPSKAEARSGTKASETGTRRRKISMGPIDFESRREQIKLSYSKSIKETEARAAARRLAEEKRKTKILAEAEAEAVAQAQAQAQAQAEVSALTDTQKIPGEQRLSLEHDEEAKQKAQDSAPTELDAAQTNGITESSKDRPLAQPILKIATDLRNSDTSVILPPPSQQQQKISISPELVLPGSFPSLATPQTPQLEKEDAPPSAVSDTTEFDNEPQTEPAIQAISTTTAEANPAAENVHDHSIFPRRISEYRSPFDDDDSPTSDRMSIKITLEDVIDPVHSSVAPTPTDTEFGESQIGQDSCDEIDDDEYVPRPMVHPSSQTTVTIIGRNTDFSPPSSENVSQSLDTPNAHPRGTGLGLQDCDTNRLGVFVQSPEPYSGDAQSEDPDKLNSYFHGTKVDVGTEVGDSADAESYAQISPAEPDPARKDVSQTADASSSMRAMRELDSSATTDSVNRSSQASIWTDYSIHSRTTRSSQIEKHEQFEVQSTATRRESGLTSGSGPYDRLTPDRLSPDQLSPDRLSPERLSPDLASSTEFSPRDMTRDFVHEVKQSEHLPAVDTGADFTFKYDDHKGFESGSSSRPVHPPPPPPQPEEPAFKDGTASGPPSDYYDDTRPSSYAQGTKDDQSEVSLDRLRPISDVFTASESAARSTDQVSVATSEGPSTTTTPPDNQGLLTDEATQLVDEGSLSPKEKKRLFTRLQTIKELIDTEAFFIRDMNIVEEIYKGTAEACPQLDDNTIKLIFRNTDEIIAFHTQFSAELKEGVASIYIPKHRNKSKGSIHSDGSTQPGPLPNANPELSDEKDRETSLGPIFTRNMDAMKAVHETFLKNSDHAAKRLIQIQENPTVKVWLNECNEVARDLTKAWNLDSLLIKPMQRITKYPNLLMQLLGETPNDHPDRLALQAAKEQLETAIEEINKTKKNFELVGQIVGRKGKETDVRAGFARAFGKRVDKLQPSSSRPEEDVEYTKLHEKFGDDYLRLQVVLRDVEYYTRQVSDYVHIFLQFLSSMELVMRLQPSPHPEIESKWVRFNVSMRDIEKVALAQHLSQVRKHVIEPFELVIKSYGNPSLAMKKRSKRRLDYERSLQLKKNGKKIDKQTADAAEQYEALNETLKKELPKLSDLTEKVGNICLANLINIQTQWYSVWKDKVKMVLDDPTTPEIADIITTFSRDYVFQEEQINAIGIVNSGFKGRSSQSTSTDESTHRLRLRPAELSPRSRGFSLNSDTIPSLPTPDFMKHNSGQFTASPSASTVPSPGHQYYRDYYSGTAGTRPPMQAPAMVSEGSQSGRSMTAPARPGTGQSQDSSLVARQSTDSGVHLKSSTPLMQPSPYMSSDQQRFSGLFQSALPLSDRPDRYAQSRPSQASSRASSREREPINGYNVLWLAASLFEFNIETTKTEAGYPYLTYQAGEIFDVIGEKGELWLAKNQDDPSNLVGWLWSKHFAKLADD